MLYPASWLKDSKTKKQLHYCSCFSLTWCHQEHFQSILIGVFTLNYASKVVRSHIFYSYSE